jgi:hypothetical protein
MSGKHHHYNVEKGQNDKYIVKEEECSINNYLYTKKDVNDYIIYLINTYIKKLLAKKSFDIKLLCKSFNKYNFLLDDSNGSPFKVRNDLKETEFNKLDESNPFSYIVSMWVLKELNDPSKQLEAVHDGWAICRLMSLNKEGFVFNYKTNRTSASPKIDINDDKDYNFLLNLENTSDNFNDSDIIKTTIKTLDKSYITLNYNIDEKQHETSIRGNQLCMFLPFNKISKRIQLMDKPYLDAYLEDNKYIKFIDEITPNTNPQKMPKPTAGGKKSKNLEDYTIKELKEKIKKRFSKEKLAKIKLSEKKKADLIKLLRKK